MTRLQNEHFLNIANFSFLLQSFKDTYRTITLPISDELENDAEHSYDLSMMCLYVVNVFELVHLDLKKVLIYALVHDLVEVYTGDICRVTSTEEQIKQKELEEKKAIGQFKTLYSEFPQLSQYIEDYEKQEDEESQFVFAMDRLVPFFVEYAQNFKASKQKNSTKEELLKVLRNCSRHPNVFYLAMFFEPIIEEMFDVSRTTN